MSTLSLVYVRINLVWVLVYVQLGQWSWLASHWSLWMKWPIILWHPLQVSPSFSLFLQHSFPELFVDDIFWKEARSVSGHLRVVLWTFVFKQLLRKWNKYRWDLSTFSLHQLLKNFPLFLNVAACLLDPLESVTQLWVEFLLYLSNIVFKLAKVQGIGIIMSSFHI